MHWEEMIKEESEHVGRREGLYESAYQRKTDGVFNFRIHWKRVIYTGIDLKRVGRWRAITKYTVSLRASSSTATTPVKRSAWQPMQFLAWPHEKSTGRQGIRCKLTKREPGASRARPTFLSSSSLLQNPHRPNPTGNKRHRINLLGLLGQCNTDWL